jgi:DNA-directed RNA polymerase subunit M
MGPTTKARCPECGHDRAAYEMKQIRAADESETRFFTCTECDHKWREDDH